MQTVESLIRELQKFPTTARCHAYEGEPIPDGEGVYVHSYIVVSDGDGPALGLIPCTEKRTQDGPALIR